MKILSAYVGFGPRSGGAGERFYAMGSHLLAAGADVRLLLTGKYLERDQTPRGYPFPTERMTVLPLANARYDLPFPLLGRIDRAVRNADVVHILNHLSPLSLAVTLAALRHRKPWLVCAAGMLPFRGRSLRLKRWTHQLYGRTLLRDAARIIAITEDERTVLTPLAASPEKVVLIPNAIAQPGPVSAPPDETILFLGGFHPTKGADLLVEALAQIPVDAVHRHQLVLAGAYEENRATVENLAQRLGLRNRVRFAGWLDRDEKLRALAAASFVVIPSRVDAMTIVVLEAAALGKPVLLTTGCGFPDVARCGGGLMVEPTSQSLAKGLRQMFEARTQWSAMGERMRSVAETYSWSAITRRYLRTFESVLSEPRR